MNIIQRYKRLKFWNKLAVWGALASIFALVFSVIFWIYPLLTNPNSVEDPVSKINRISSKNNKIEIISIKLSARSPVWGREIFDDDEIIANITGRAEFQENIEDASIVAFWRLANDYVTNWHVGRRRVGGNYNLAQLPRYVLESGEWDFLVGGIECEKEYQGDVSIVLLLYPNEIIKKNSYTWREDSNGWGFRELPEGFLCASITKTFYAERAR